MATADLDSVIALLKRVGSGAEVLSQSYTFGTITQSKENEKQIGELRKAKLIRLGNDANQYRLNADLKRMLNRLLKQQTHYRSQTAMGDLVNQAQEYADDYQYSLLNGFDDDADYYFDALEDLLFDARDSIERSIESMAYAISNQFGFVSSISAKVRENERALKYSQNLLTELSQINPEHFYAWFDWACPNEFARNISNFIRWYQQILGRIRHLIERMSESLFRLRKQEKQASQLKAMARMLRKRADYQIPENLYQHQLLPQALKITPALTNQAWVDLKQENIAVPLTKIVHRLRKLSQDFTKLDRQRGSVEDLQQITIEAVPDWVNDEIENYLEAAIIESGQQGQLWALQYWQHNQQKWLHQHQQELPAKLWLELIFAYYCKLSPRLQQSFRMELEEQQVCQTNNNFTFSDLNFTLAS
ncbi:hypothetical protein [Paraferrimonas sp. SM1919]|uniref:hypothetical protein n=1 Tax=Paraferrimonas sp. SM1919 TaxID=2662263 RepID=UPI0013D12089|nr:hypothetical protein [Paraferrimonas sp. SM1919]